MGLPQGQPVTCIMYMYYMYYEFLGTDVSVGSGDNYIACARLTH